MASLSTRRQAAVLALRDGQLCMVTSNSGRRWVIPKGQIDPGKTGGETALQEAWEEAGLVGVLRPEPVGSYLYEKWGLVHHVIVFVLQVNEIADNWPERRQRHRAWVPVAQAIERIEEPGLRDIIRSVFPPATGKVAEPVDAEVALV